MVGASVLEDNSRALVGRLSSIQTHKPFTSFLIAPVCIFIKIQKKIFIKYNLYLKEVILYKTFILSQAVNSIHIKCE